MILVMLLVYNKEMYVQRFNTKFQGKTNAANLQICCNSLNVWQYVLQLLNIMLNIDKMLKNVIVLVY